MVTESTDDVLVLRPDRLRAGLWSLVGIASLWLVAWSTVVGGLRRDVALGLLVFGTLLTLLVAMQAVTPHLWTLRVGLDRVTGRIAGFGVDAAYAGHDAVDVSHRFGEPRLVLRGRPKRILVLPLGSDVAALRTHIARIDLSASAP